MSFHDTYTVKQGDTLTGIGRQFGFDNPGPIVAYPRNAGVLKGGSADLIRPGQRFLVPWRSDLLRKFIATGNALKADIARHASALIREQKASQAKLEEFLTKIDQANFLANIAVGIGGLAVQGMKGVEMSSKEALTWLVESRVSMATSVTPIPNPDAPKQDYKFYLRHALGPWNPSFWASVWVAVKEKDLDLYLYGADAVARRTPPSWTPASEKHRPNCKCRAIGTGSR
jgi:LysM domain